MNAPQIAEKIWRWFKTLLVIVVTLMPIWYAPFRTASVQSHLMAWALIVIAGLVFCVMATGSAYKRLNNLIQCLVGGIIGFIGTAVIGWDVFVNFDDEQRLVFMYFIAALGVWFMLTHRTDDGGVTWK